MFSHSRTEIRSHRLQPLNQPKPIKVQVDGNDTPISITCNGQRIAVEGIKDRWRIDDEWWRKEISRFYYQVVLKDGRMFTLFHDLIDGGWFTQSVSLPMSRKGSLLVFVGHSAEATSKRTKDRHYASF